MIDTADIPIMMDDLDELSRLEEVVIVQVSVNAVKG